MRQGFVGASRRAIGIRPWLLASSLLLFLSPAGLAFANPAIKFSTTYYDIVGHTVSELAKQMDLLGPKDEGGAGNGAADTLWAVDTQWTDRYGASYCRAVGARVSATIRYRFPRWTNEGDADATMRAEWERFMAALRTHEAGHAQHGEDAARAVEKALLALPGGASCEAVDAEAAAVTNRIIDSYQALDVEYDRVTQHGIVQGTTLKGESFGAIAYGPGGRVSSWDYGAETPGEADREALSSCAKMASDCRIVVDFSNGCAALALGRESQFGVARAGSRDQAVAGALAACQRGSGGECKIAASPCVPP
jgi:predicted secreted Zn-dependent protease